MTTDATERVAGARVAGEDTPEEAAFRAEVREWFTANAKSRDVDDETGNYFAMADNNPEAHAAHVSRCKTWQRKLYEGGWAGITLPKEYGGRGGERSATAPGVAASAHSSTVICGRARNSQRSQAANAGCGSIAITRAPRPSKQRA